MRRFRTLMLLLLALIGISVLVHFFPIGRWIAEQSGAPVTERPAERR
jgi:hypothetical protein